MSAELSPASRRCQVSPSSVLHRTPSISTPTGSSPLSPVGDTESAPVPIGVGVGGLVLLALLVQPFLGERIARACGTVLATGHADTCRWEER